MEEVRASSSDGNQRELSSKDSEPSETKSNGAKLTTFQIGGDDDIDEEPKKLSRSVSQDPHVLYRNPANQSSQDFPRTRHISATVAPTMPMNGNKMRRNHSSNSVSSQSIYPKTRMQQTKNGSMVLQLVLPPGARNSSFDNGFLTAPGGNDALGNNLKRRPRNGSVHSSPREGYSPFGYGGFNNPGFTSDGFDFPNNVGSIKGPQTIISEMSHVSPTPPEEKKRMFREYLTTILSFVYAAILITFGITTYVAHVVVDLTPVPEIFSYYIVCTSLFFIWYIIFDVKRFMNRRRDYNELLEHNKTEEVEFQENAEGGLNLSIPLPAAAKLQEALPHHYCYSTGRHAGSFYLKVGAAAFCLGHLVHNGLHIGYQIVFLTSDEEGFYECANVVTLILDIIYSIYAFSLLFFIFKYSNVIVNRRIPLARFGFMHCMAASLCFWVYTIIRETFDALAFYGGGEYYEEYTESLPALSKFLFKNVAEGLIDFNRTSRLFTPVCTTDHGMAIIYQNFSPYLYPFSVEFNILVIGILYIVWASIGTCKQNFEHNQSAADLARDCDSNMEGPEPESNLTIHADCHSSNKGIFLGIFIFIVLVINIIMFFIAANDERFSYLGLTINVTTEMVVLFIMGIGALWAYWKIVDMDVNHHHISLLDDVLLFICIPAFALYAIFTIRAAIEFYNGLNIAFSLIQITQVIIQTSFIIDGLRRCSNCRELRQKKPGREVITFLIITNVAMWIHQTFEVRSHGLHDDRYEFFGVTLWGILGHVCLPLMMFYRFHASVCLVDIWKYAYEKASH